MEGEERKGVQFQFLWVLKVTVCSDAVAVGSLDAYVHIRLACPVVNIHCKPLCGPS